MSGIVFLVEVPVRSKKSVRGYDSEREARKQFEKEEVAVLYKKQLPLAQRKRREDLIAYKGVSEEQALKYNRKIGVWRS